MENTQSNPRLISVILKGIAVAMGIAAIVLNILGAASPQTSGMLLGLGLGLAALAIVALRG
jgi:hypothetical protein